LALTFLPSRGRGNDPEDKRADELVSKALALDPNYAPAHLIKAFVLLSQSRLDEAVAEVAPHEIAEIRNVLSEYLPDANGDLLSTAVCKYTNTPDEHFILDYHPEFPQVVVASPCSGHGFKFSPVIGEIIAEMVHGKRPQFDLDLFKLSRFSQ